MRVRLDIPNDRCTEDVLQIVVNPFVSKAPAAYCLHMVAILPNPLPLYITMMKFRGIRCFVKTKHDGENFVTSALLPEMQLKVRQL